MQHVGLILRLAQKTKAWNSGRPSKGQSCCLSRGWQIVFVKIAERNLDDAEAELLLKKT